MTDKLKRVAVPRHSFFFLCRRFAAAEKKERNVEVAF